MKERGFTLVELITTFALTAVIVVLLINILVVIRNIYSKTNIKTELYINQSNLSIAMNKKIKDDNLDSISKCNDEEFCYDLSFYSDDDEDGDPDSLKLTINNKTIKFGDYVYKIGNDVNVVNPEVVTEDNILVIKIPIKHKVYPNIDFGINLVYPYDSNEIQLILE